MLNYPTTIECGDVNDFDIQQLNGCGIDLFLCGSPCQDMSLININKRSNLDGSKSSLFYKCAEILRIVQPKYFLFENVASMKNIDRDKISEILGVQPILIDSALLTAQKRRRYYWTNIPNVSQPQDKNILLRDIVEHTDSYEEKWSNKKTDFVERKASTMYVQVDGDKSIPITARGYAAWNTQFVSVNGRIRDLTIREYKKLQTIPEWYSFGELIKSKITDLIGDAWTVDVIAHILSFMSR